MGSYQLIETGGMCRPLRNTKMAKKNKDGLDGGSLVSEKDHLRVSNDHRKKASKLAKAKAEEAAKKEAEPEV